MIKAYGVQSSGWINKPVELYHDAAIDYEGKKGGSRIRIPELTLKEQNRGDIHDIMPDEPPPPDDDDFE